LNQNTSDLEDKLCKIGDSIVYKLVKWTRRLPFYDQLPVGVHTKLLTHKWHELLVLTTSAYQAIHGYRRMGTTTTDGEKVELHQEVKLYKRPQLWKNDSNLKINRWQQTW
jgi:nuclear receptor subfamily 6 group A